MKQILLAVLLVWSAACNSRPAKLYESEKTITVAHTNWACNCADFIETNLLKEGEGAKEEDYIFIEAVNDSLRIPESFYEKKYFDYYLKLTGKFYLQKGVSKTYDAKTPERTEPAKVFRYDKYKLVKKQAN